MSAPKAILALLWLAAVNSGTVVSLAITAGLDVYPAANPNHRQRTAPPLKPVPSRPVAASLEVADLGQNSAPWDA